MPSAQLQACSDFLLKVAGNRAGALQEPMLMAGDPELWALGCSSPQALPTLPTRLG